MRESGILMHITSLPGPYGIGAMGAQAYQFVDFLEQAGQSYWQILPLNPTGYGDSPYQAFSAGAGNHYLIDLDALVEKRLLTKEELAEKFWGENANRVDFGAQYSSRLAVLRTAFERFVPDDKYNIFVRENSGWLEDYSLFMALKNHFGGQCWLDWPKELRFHEEGALCRSREEFREEINFQKFLQYLFFDQWLALRAYARSKGIRIIGDVPIYVPLDSADVWANPELFLLNGDRRPVAVAGCPPDGFNADGQLWGHPVYDWGKMDQTGYAWWIHRLQSAARMYDVVRIDHFRAFESFWSVPAEEDTARNGTWVKGPGMTFIRAIREALPELEFIAEDLGFVTPGVRQLLKDSGYPGMKVLAFAFDSREESDYLPHRYSEHSVCYTGTHDNATLLQWFREASQETIAYAKEYLGLNEEEGYVWGMIRGVMSSVSRLCVVPIQDYLEIGKEGRMNFPGKVSTDNWTWRAREGFDRPALSAKIRELTRMYGRMKS